MATIAPPGTSVSLTMPSGLKVFTAPTGGAQVTSGTSLSILSTNLWAEGAQASSQMMDSRISAQINGSGPSAYITFTVLWATMTYMTSGTDPANAPAFLGNIPGGTTLGAQFTNGQSAAWGKMCAVATVSPVGVNAYFSNGWNLVQQIIGTSFSNGVVNPFFTHATWTNDGPEAAFVTTNLDNADKLYTTDAPNIAGFGASSSYETYFNFYDYATWNSQRCSSTNTFWHWRGMWKADQTPQVTTADVNNGMITIPTSPYYPPP